ncbi:MetQ/NlpA family ABC transporter substrate-binding protein [Aeromonas simiae]|uniref:MetQ/NlpA family ABC transporter substrate-binding protein n=1 Tax=Aeromonas simiae TaxID=218936 RepID=UPI0005A785D9|nr:MetQ/NlpA family ABC transporter substrate-binding protein [Aeromonas simiae]
MKKNGLFSFAGVALALGFAFSSQAAQALRVAADPLPHAEILGEVKRQDPALDLHVIELSGGINANELLVAGDVDANYFQHVPYLKDQEKALGTEFVVAATVHVEPLGIYSKKFKHLDQVPAKAVIALPNNVTNLSRALYLLQSKGLITLKAGYQDPARDLATVQDIASNPKGLKILEIEAPQLPRSLDDVDLAVINGNYALEAGLEPARDALGLESAEHNPYANILVTTPALKDDPRIRQLARDLESKAIADFIRKSYKGSVIPVAGQSS